MKLPDHVSESVKRLNPDLYPVGGLVPAKREPSAKPALEPKPQEREAGARSFCLRVTLISLRRRLLDDDNAIAGCKPLRDAIARSLGIDDADSCIAFQYGQQCTEGRQGVIVVVEAVIGAKKAISDARKRVL